MAPIGGVRAGYLSTAKDAIPDSVDYQWRADEGSGTTLNADIGSVSMSLQANTWTTDNRFFGGAAPDHDGTDDYAQTDSDIGSNTSNCTIIFWTSFDSTPGSFARFASNVSDVNQRPDNGWALETGDSSTSNVSVELNSGGSGTFPIQNATVPDITSNDIMWALALDGNSVRLEVYNRNSHQSTYTASGTRGTTSLSPLSLMATNGSYWEGELDAIHVSTDTTLPKSDIDAVWGETK